MNNVHEMEHQSHQKKFSQPGTSSNTITTTTLVVHEKASKPANMQFPRPKLSEIRQPRFELMGNGKNFYWGK